jgi:hypothetical protein
VKPILQALVLADRVYEDKSGKKIIVGTFSGIKFCRQPPIVHIKQPDGTSKPVVVGGMAAGSPYVYLCLADVVNGTTLQVQFINLSKNVVLFGTSFQISEANRLKNVEVVLPLPLLPVSEPGTYAIEVLWEGEVLGSWRITAEELQPGSEQKENEDGAGNS